MVEQTGDGLDLFFNDVRVKRSVGTGKRFRLGHGFGQRAGRLFDFGAPVAEGVGDGGQDALEAGAAHAVFGWEVSAAEKGLSFGRKETSQWPAALSGNGADGRLVARIDVGALVAVHFDWDVELVDERCDFGVLVALAVDDMAPVAPDRADIEQDGFVLGAGAGEGFFAPLVPGDGLVRGRAQVGAGGIAQTVRGMVGHDVSLETRGGVNPPLHELRAGTEARPYTNRRAHCPPLLNRIAWAGVARVKRLAAGEPLVLPVVEADTVFAQPPAQIDFLVFEDRREVE